MKAFLSILIFLFINPLMAQVEKYPEIMNQDWPNLQKYREANKKIETAPIAVFMGNSITEGWANMHPDFFSSNNFLGRGISGQTTPQMLIRFQQDVVDLKPKVVVILAGTNDIAGNTGFSTVKMITDNMKSMAEIADANNIKVILSSVLPAYDYPWRTGLEPAPKIMEVNNWLEDFAKKHGYVYLDYFSAMKDDRNGLPKEYSHDGVHPTSEGYDIMEPLAKKAIEKALAE